MVSLQLCCQECLIKNARVEIVSKNLAPYILFCSVVFFLLVFPRLYTGWKISGAEGLVTLYSRAHLADEPLPQTGVQLEEAGTVWLIPMAAPLGVSPEISSGGWRCTKSPGGRPTPPEE